jgi:hypothetical protein
MVKAGIAPLRRERVGRLCDRTPTQSLAAIGITKLV